MKGLVVFILGLLLSGCAYPTYQVRVNGYIQPGDAPRLAPPASICVLDNKEAQDPLLDQEIKAKIEKLLGEQGHIISPFDQADYYLMFHVSQGPARPVTMPVPVYGPGPYPYYGGYWRPYAFAPVPYYAPPLQTVQERWLLINVIEGRRYREKGEFQRVWLGEARSVFGSGDLRTTSSYLLVALFNEFGKSTRGARLVEVEPGDFRVIQLGG